MFTLQRSAIPAPDLRHARPLPVTPAPFSVIPALAAGISLSSAQGPRRHPVIPAQAGTQAISSACPRRDAATACRSRSASPPNVQRQTSRAYYVGSCLRRNDGGGAGMMEGEVGGKRSAWGWAEGRSRRAGLTAASGAWCSPRRDTRGERGYDGVEAWVWWSRRSRREGGADGGIRTPTGLSPLRPERSASANFATSAWITSC